jgi:hypothetical protein
MPPNALRQVLAASKVIREERPILIRCPLPAATPTLPPTDAAGNMLPARRPSVVPGQVP